jgi:hypothetical protein
MLIIENENLNNLLVEKIKEVEYLKEEKLN